MAEVSASRYVVHAGWEDAAHLDDKTKRELMEATPPYLRDARSKGIPSLGAGAIYPIPWEEVSCAPFAIPAYWKKGYALDVGWNKTAGLWGAQDPSDGMMYVYSEHYQGQELPSVHAGAIKARGDWMTGAIDPAARGRSQADGRTLISQYQQQGLKLETAINAVEPGLHEVWSLLVTGRLKLFTTLQSTAAEYRLYRRAQKTDENGVTRTKIVKKNDHLMDALRYLVMTWAAIARTKPNDTFAGQTSQAADRLAGY